MTPLPDQEMRARGDAVALTARRAGATRPRHEPPATAPDGPASHSAAGAAGVPPDSVALLRRYHLGEPQAAAQTRPPDADLLPALLSPLRNAGAIRYEYPLYLHPPRGGAATPLATPLARLLQDRLERVAGGPDAARILRDHLPWIERWVREELGSSGAPVAAAALLTRSGEALQEHLQLSDAHRAQLGMDLAKWVAAVDTGGQFLGYGPAVALQLFVHVIRHRGARLERAFAGEVAEHIRGLKRLLGIERSKTAVAGDAASGDVGSVSQYFDTAALSSMLEQRSHGSVRMSEERRQRIARALETLEAYRESAVVARLVSDRGEASGTAPGAVEAIASADPCATAAEVFEREATRCAGVFAAARIAKLEIDGAYEPAVHDSWFATFDWQAFSPAELALVTPVIALESADRVAGDGLRSCSRLLSSRKPIQMLVWTDAYDHPGAAPGTDPLQAFRFELGYFGIGHRQVFVCQASAARHADLLSGFGAALDANRAGLHLVDRGFQPAGAPCVLDPWIVASAALESRAHPFIQFNPAAGDQAAGRVKFAANPQPHCDWPSAVMSCPAAEGGMVETTLAFTFVDYALLIGKLRSHFRVVPAGCECADFVTAEAYLERAPGAGDRAIPYIWAVDAAGAFQRLVVSRSLLLAARDRRNYWHALQELSGVRNRYVELAREKVRDEERSAAAAARERLQASHATELERVRAEAAGTVMGHLADALLAGDFSGAVKNRADAAPAVAVIPAPAAVVVESPAVVEEATVRVVRDPWIESMLCTTCDDCMSLNKRMFAYNENKQAVIRDPRAGTYAELVEAAESCPARCIHPGMPLDPQEPGVEELIKRAEPYN